MTYKQYELLKNSRIDWIEQIPEHWKVSKFKYGIELIESGNRDSVEFSEVLSIGGEHIGNNGKLRLSNLKYVSEEYYNKSTKGRVQQGDILIVKDGATIGKTAFVDDPPEKKMLLNEHVYRVVANKFIYYFILSSFFQSKIWSENNSTAQEGLNQSTIKEIPLLIPSSEEQNKIADFLDYEVSVIDSLIEKQRSVIQLLREKQDSVISESITKGLNPQACFKDSGIEWLGKIPKHWQILRAKYLFKEQQRAVRESDGIVTVFRDGQVCLRSKRRETGFTMAVLEHGYQGIRKGDLVLHSMDAFAGAIGVSEDDGRATPEYVVTTPYDENNNSEYYANILRLMAKRDFIFVLCPSVRERAPRFRFSKFQEVLLPVPPPQEQKEINDYINSVSNKYFNLIQVSEKQIDLLLERKISLISAAVTGKIDLRNWTQTNKKLLAQDNKEVDL